jgi:hypothetical protein
MPDPAAVGLGGSIRRGNGPGRSSQPTGWASCWHSSCSAPASTLWTFRRHRRHGCWARPRPRRTITTKRCRLPSPGCGTASCAPSASRIHRRDPPVDRPLRRPGVVADPGHVPAACRAARAHRRRRTQAFVGQLGRQAAAQRPSPLVRPPSNANGSPSIDWPTYDASTSRSPRRDHASRRCRGLQDLPARAARRRTDRRGLHPRPRRQPGPLRHTERFASYIGTVR